MADQQGRGIGRIVEELFHELPGVVGAVLGGQVGGGGVQGVFQGRYGEGAHQTAKARQGHRGQEVEQLLR